MFFFYFFYQLLPIGKGLVKNMMWCPITKSDCWDECAWFAEGQCAFARLHDISDSLDEIQDRLMTLDDTINNKDFTQ